MSSNWPEGVGRIILPEIDSTNAEAARRVGSLAGPVWILAHRQTKGRGRRGRAWSDPVGNFSATYVARPDGPPDQVALRSFVAALALDEALVAVTGRPDSFAIKWPNDVLLHGGKLAGILLESVGENARVNHLAIGIGVNLRHAPEPEEGALTPVSLLAETGVQITPEEFLGILAPAYARWDAQLSTFGFGPVRQAWLARAARLGQPIVARTVAQSFEGTFVGIDSSGALLLQMPQETRAIPAAEVFFS
ncbi:biotin--[acetyl-CoA-carboxylase] ligase [Roseinatronobacter bogoriensis]|uniref:biotin--[biotin carboxyl-carrier protein] ligase n=1 Tax=Roseinatronobacter bogoriensis subsp. barguzinensis TaxID=441209 RepID=A0A2K8KA30_9RHOB|nr:MULTISPECIES: biotin--[acetyl-CoA-carboxylase] ligase [Rhodobaca]ATX66321.1 biotin--[acetyl-CoA-carboxylase] ligase [Rhodobaca barguzinensis]MBB4207452.1 BirA family biotin operon repressor/biotin-[acetyl-CoA-carboxylase] ligase [Rhodobaca bogoriensis DSM 18756]TDW40241.1 BirA family biotin operon repressor/biotin-[acetyl-CoA-carboxylase] ligase [Rhodobaca barguzinensis]TDY70607.1 BirA family biotin operon repressor/biotin-[acetyl-CoA-carboxylase] ligase [Rhodobaca bogoriensis DSM 18756]